MKISVLWRECGTFAVVFLLGVELTSAQGLRTVDRPAQAVSPLSITHKRDQFLSHDGKQITANVFTVDVRRARIEVHGARDLIARGLAQRGAGLSELAKAVTRGRGTKQSITGPVLALSGGNILSAPDSPMGWLVSNGVELSPLDTRPSIFKRRDSDPVRARECQTKSDEVGRRLGGILCIKDTEASIELTRVIEAGDGKTCRQAIQSLPVVIHPKDASNGICRSEVEADYSGAPSSRSVVCVDGEGRVHFILTAPSMLYPLAEWLREPKGLNCKAALNLVGDYFAAAQFSPGGKASTLLVGNQQVAQASMLFITSR